LPEFTRDILDRARRSRDARFDGKFFIAVMTTRIYCRPVCPARTSKDCNVRYYATAAEAAQAGFRPCLRCRPEAAPGSPAWIGTSAVVRRALRLIQEGALNEGSVDQLAARLGIGCRHLSRLFAQHVGASPAAVAHTARLHFAKRLLDDTGMSITDIALASGFKSVRRFNDAFRSSYRRTPSDLRRHRSMGDCEGGSAEILLRLAYRPPYDWAHLIELLSWQAIPGVETVDPRGYMRAVQTTGGYAVLRVRPVPDEDALELRISGALPSDLMLLLASVRRMFDLAADPARIEFALGGDVLLRPLIARRPGLRIPGVWDPFECAVRAILLQQISDAESRVLLGRLVERLGKPIERTESGISRLFPTVDAIAEAHLDDIGLPAMRMAALRLLARGVKDGSIRFDASSEDVGQALGTLPGVGRWAAEYVALRGLGEPDGFPCEDSLLRQHAERWRPFRGYAIFHLWQTGCHSNHIAQSLEVRKQPVPVFPQA
jgi:AraC family transcriptional regulator, regulatory protein of adaptative response / DNA-3-methyladenine glycosylase II